MAKTDQKRVERIREEILEAKKVAGIEPPRLIPRGENFRSAATGRPEGAVSVELANPHLCRDPDDDVLPAYAGVDNTAIAPFLKKALGDDLELVLARAERAVDRLEAENGQKLATAIADQLNLVSGVLPDSDRAYELRARLDKIRFGDVDYKDQRGMPGGGQKSG